MSLRGSVISSLMAARNSARGFPLVPGPAHFHRRTTGADIAPMPFGCFETLSRTAHFTFEDFSRCSFACRWHHVRLISKPIAPLRRFQWKHNSKSALSMVRFSPYLGQDVDLANCLPRRSDWRRRVGPGCADCDYFSSCSRQGSPEQTPSGKSNSRRYQIA